MASLIAGAIGAPLKRYITQVLHSYLKEYIKDIELESIGVLGSDLVLQNLELRLDVLQEKLDLFDLTELPESLSDK